MATKVKTVWNILKQSEEESDLHEDGVLEVCSCSCDEKACDSYIDEADL